MAVNEKEHIFIYDSIYYETLHVFFDLFSYSHSQIMCKISRFRMMILISLPHVPAATSIALTFMTPSITRTITVKKGMSTNSPLPTTASATITRLLLLIKMIKLWKLIFSWDALPRSIWLSTKIGVRI